MFDIIKLNHFNKTAEGSSPERILGDLEIKPGYVIGDIGSGGGFYTIRFAGLTGDSGRVYAVDIEQGNLDYVAKKVKEEGLEQRITLVRGTDENSMLPEDVIDFIFLRNSFHHLKNRVEYFKNLKGCFKPGGKIAIIDHKKGHRSGPGINHGTGEGEIEKVMQEAGFVKQNSFDYLSGQWFYIYKKVG